jgi:hypothetical protein
LSSEASTTTSLPVEHLFSVHLDIGASTFIKDGPQGNKIIAPIASGTITGARVNGIVVPNSGADWVSMGPKGEMRLDVRFTIHTNDDAAIYVTYGGVLAAGRALSAPLFETGDERYTWLNALQGVGIGSAQAGGVDYEFYALV